ncbi:MAG: molybdopterin dinucleotide binding domain-containing protein, partial [Desulfococcaceae bacterium]
LAVDWTFGTEALSAEYSPILKKVEKRPHIAIHPEDAASLGLSEGETLRITTEAGGISAPVHTAESMARRTLVVPRHRDLDWQHLGGRRTTVSKDQLRKPSKET